MTYAAHGAWSGYSYHNNVSRTNTYNTRLLPAEVKDVLPGYSTPALDLQYGYANNGNVSSLQIQSQTTSGGSQLTFNQSYTYDALNRLASAGDNGGGTGWSENFGYDRYGNMWLSSICCTGTIPAQSMMPIVSTAYSTSTNQLAGIAPDAAGNQTTFGAYTIGYDAENRQISATSTSPSLNATYAYDGTGQRVLKAIAAGATTIYVHDAFGNLAAEYTTGTPPTTLCATCYLSWDHLGTTRMVTDGNGTIIARHDHLPFGPEIPATYSGRTSIWGVTDNLNPKFTSQERDTETGIDFFKARYHLGAQGRFISPDPAGNFVATVTDPQSWNMYSYTRNNPLNLVDPTGLDFQQIGNCIYNTTNFYVDGDYDSSETELVSCFQTGGTGGGGSSGSGSSAQPPPTLQSQRNCTSNPASASQYVAATTQVAAMTGEFFSGLGPGNLTFGTDSATSQVMGQSGPVQDVLNSYYMAGQTSGLHLWRLWVCSRRRQSRGSVCGFIQVEHYSEQWRYQPFANEHHQL
jgi:RHS repeat-associated protein